VPSTPDPSRSGRTRSDQRNVDAQKLVQLACKSIRPRDACRWNLTLLADEMSRPWGWSMTSARKKKKKTEQFANSQKKTNPPWNRRYLVHPSKVNPSTSGGWRT